MRASDSSVMCYQRRSEISDIPRGFLKVAVPRYPKLSSWLLLPPTPHVFPLFSFPMNSITMMPPTSLLSPPQSNLSPSQINLRFYIPTSNTIIFPCHCANWWTSPPLCASLIGFIPSQQPMLIAQKKMLSYSSLIKIISWFLIFLRIKIK